MASTPHRPIAPSPQSLFAPSQFRLAATTLDRFSSSSPFDQSPSMELARSLITNGAVMKRSIHLIALLAVGLAAVACGDSETGPRSPIGPSSLQRGQGRSAFGFNGVIVNGAGTPVVTLNGGGSFDPATG